MKKIIVLLLLMLPLFGFSQSNTYNYKFTYKVAAKQDLDDENLQIEENMALYVGKEKSLYISDVKLKIDSASAAIKKRKGSPYEISEFRQTLPKNRIVYSFEKNYKKSEIIFTTMVFPSNELYYTEPLSKFKWQIQTEEKQILGYTCQKATLHYKGRNYVAWFSNSIPLQDGPWKFGGLPGLIFEIADTQNHYSFKIIALKKETKPFPQTNTNPIKTTKSGYASAVENVIKSFEDMLIGDSKIRFKRQRQEGKKNIKPNPIELEK